MTVYAGLDLRDFGEDLLLSDGKNLSTETLPPVATFAVASPSIVNTGRTIDIEMRNTGTLIPWRLRELSAATQLIQDFQIRR